MITKDGRTLRTKCFKPHLISQSGEVCDTDKKKSLLPPLKRVETQKNEPQKPEFHFRSSREDGPSLFSGDWHHREQEALARLLEGPQRRRALEQRAKARPDSIYLAVDYNAAEEARRLELQKEWCTRLHDYA
ncbi:unnamed protein product [Protopolystoma xenopodis]|uniref:Uncharacterized protein n=1 Tax=Protopolystoma xenopodis TaxID=117903 RepID=A0A448WBV3_9PLAT|nr:unnamed protein product [Protopolystoma xenopodis]